MTGHEERLESQEPQQQNTQAEASEPQATEAAEAGDAASSTATATVAETSEEGLRLEKLEIDVEKLDEIRRRFRIRVPADEVQRLLDQQLEQYASKIHLRGFRPGRAPTRLVFRKFRQEFLEELKNFLVGQALKKLVEDEYDFVDEPDLDVYALNPPEPGKDFEFEFTAEVRPSFELPEYKGIEVERPEPEVTEEDVDETIRSWMELYGQYEEVDEPVRRHDVVIADLVFQDGDRTLLKQEDERLRVVDTLQLRDAIIRDFAAALEGKRAGETVELEAEVLENAADESLRGKKIKVLVTIKSVLRLGPNALRETMEQLGVENEEQLRSQVESLLRRRVEALIQRLIRERVLSKLIEQAKFELPEELIRRQQEVLVRREVRRLILAGYSRDEIRAEIAALRPRLLEQTERELREFMVLSAIARAEGIKVTDEMIDEYVRELAERQETSPRRLRTRLEKEGVLPEIEAEILEELTVQRLLDYCNFVPAAEPARLPKSPYAELEFIDAYVAGEPTESAATEKRTGEAPEGQEASAEQQPEAAGQPQSSDAPEPGEEQ